MEMPRIVSAMSTFILLARFPTALTETLPLPYNFSVDKTIGYVPNLYRKVKARL